MHEDKYVHNSQHNMNVYLLKSICTLRWSSGGFLLFFDSKSSDEDNSSFVNNTSNAERAKA